MNEPGGLYGAVPIPQKQEAADAAGHRESRDSGSRLHVRKRFPDAWTPDNGRLDQNRLTVD